MQPIKSVESAPFDDSGHVFTVGTQGFFWYDGRRHPHTPVLITIEADVPALHGMMERVVVWADHAKTTMIAEIPRHMVSLIKYEVPA